MAVLVIGGADYIGHAEFWRNIKPRKTLNYLSLDKALSGKHVSLITEI